MKKIILLIFLLLGLLSTTAFAEEMKEKMYLLQCLNQIEAMKPFLLAAKKEQNKQSRILFHYESYRDAKGNWHSGLLDDMNNIENGIKEALQTTIINTPTVTPIAGDYVEK